MFLGRERWGQNVDVWAMPRFRDFLSSNGPWSQLVELGNIRLNSLTELQPVSIGESVRVVPFASRTGMNTPKPWVTASKAAQGGLVHTRHQQMGRMGACPRRGVAKVDYAFSMRRFTMQEVGYRDMAEIPHPFMVETMQRLGGLPSSEKPRCTSSTSTTPTRAWIPTSQAYRTVVGSGFTARFGQILPCEESVLIALHFF